MGEMEDRSKQRTRRKNIKLITLSVIGGVGILAVGLTAPKVITAMHKLGMLPGGRQKQIINRARDRLIEQGLLEVKDGKLRITPKGEMELLLSQDKRYRLKRPRRWDKKWRVLIFDIPEHRKSIRNKIRQTLIAVGFVRLQDSVWVYPYPCEEFIALIKADFRIGKDVLYMIVEELEGDRWLKETFGLKT